MYSFRRGLLNSVPASSLYLRYPPQVGPEEKEVVCAASSLWVVLRLTACQMQSEQGKQNMYNVGYFPVRFCVWAPPSAASNIGSASIPITDLERVLSARVEVTVEK